jgi:hypothetical protein
VHLQPAVGTKIMCPRNGGAANETGGRKNRINTRGGKRSCTRPNL